MLHLVVKFRRKIKDWRMWNSPISSFLKTPFFSDFGTKVRSSVVFSSISSDVVDNHHHFSSEKLTSCRSKIFITSLEHVVDALYLLQLRFNSLSLHIRLN